MDQSIEGVHLARQEGKRYWPEIVRGDNGFKLFLEAYSSILLEAALEWNRTHAPSPNPSSALVNFLRVRVWPSHPTGLI